MVIAAVLGVAGFAIAGLAVRGAERPSRTDSLAVSVIHTDPPTTIADALTLGVAEMTLTPDASDQPHLDRSSPPRYARSIEPVPSLAPAVTALPTESTPEPGATVQPAPVAPQAPSVGVMPEPGNPATPMRKVPLLGDLPVSPAPPETLGQIFEGKRYADAAVIGSVAGLAADGTATLHIEQVVAVRSGLRIAGEVALEQSITFSDMPYGLSAPPGVAPLAEGDRVLVLVRRSGDGWRVLPLRGTWRIAGAAATADVGIRGITSANPAAGNLDADGVATLAAWARRYRDVPLAEVVNEIREAADSAGWVVG